MPRDTTFLILEEVLAIHDDQIERYGGSHGIRSLALLESAIARPQATFGGEELYPDLFIKGAVLMQGLILNHAFVDGNKRTGSVAMARFFFINSRKLICSNRALVDIAFRIEAKKISLEELAIWLKKNSKKI